jgi:hypothetical protein
VEIMIVREFIRTPPDWLEKAWRGPKQAASTKLTSADIDAEIAAYCCEKKASRHHETK